MSTMCDCGSCHMARDLLVYIRVSCDSYVTSAFYNVNEKTDFVGKGGIHMATKAQTKNEEKKIPATFIVSVKSCQNGTWQGKVTWVESKQEHAFRSTLELIRLMDSAIPDEKNIFVEE